MTDRTGPDASDRGTTPDPFDRIKAPGRRRRERPDGEGLDAPDADRLDAPDADQQGRAGLFTHGGRRGSSVPGVTVRCSRCEAVTPLDAGTALRSALPLVLVAPWRDHPVFAVCPACQRRCWLRPSVRHDR